jgi:hypothetical protein
MTKVFSDMLRENPLFVAKADYINTTYVWFEFKLDSKYINIIIDRDSIRIYQHIVYRCYDDIPKHLDTVGVNEDGEMYINKPLCIFDIIHDLPENIQEYVMYNINIFSAKEEQ